MVLICKNLLPLQPGMLVPNLVEIDPVVLEKKIFKSFFSSFAILFLSSLGKGHGPSFEQPSIPFT